MTSLRVVVFGASGQVGQRFVRLAAKNQQAVTAIYRANDAPTSTLLDGVDCRILQDFFSASEIGTLLEHATVVVSCLGLRRAVPINPWSHLVSPPDLMTRFSDALVEAMTKKAVQRLVMVSAAGVGSSVSALHPAMALLVRVSNVGVAYKDLAVMEEKLSSSTLDYTVVRPVTLVNFGARGRVRQVSKFGLFSVVSREDVSEYLLHCTLNPMATTARMPIIAT